MSQPAHGNGLEIEGLTARVGEFTLRHAALSVRPGRTLALVGPSGAGKTVLLEMIAGFRAPDAGRIRLDGIDLAGKPPEDREIGFVFQDYALFPHLTVLENVRFGLRARGIADGGAARGALSQLGIEHLAQRRPGTLSGGERQRVAVARVLAASPRLLLLDEPLSAVDAPTRDDLREELRTVLSGSGVPAIYVTHDQAEALAIADDLAVLIGGALRQSGPAMDVFTKPVDATVARFLGMEMMADAGRAGSDRARVGGAVLVLGGPLPDTAFVLCYRPEDVELAPPGGPCAVNAFDLRVTRITPAGPCDRLTMDGVLRLTAIMLRRTRIALRLEVDSAVRATVPPSALHAIAE
ncbi:MAG TPA: ABC transporter ATP-binding protein [Dehalococcoidia bacterium]|nr:ABC transporter ATP-binding protein [Dehalococcoidia bacterium]